MVRPKLKYLNQIGFKYGAARETRTLNGIPPLGPQPSLSTNSSIAALVRQNKLMTTYIQVGKFNHGNKRTYKKRN